MEAEIKNIIKTEVLKHEYGLDELHAGIIVNAVYQQMREFLNEQQLENFVRLMKPEFLLIVDNLIPIIKEYENKINDILNNKIGNLVTKL